ncbi:MAG: c-type cytochrome [Pseudomonadota bacterium]
MNSFLNIARAGALGAMLLAFACGNDDAGPQEETTTTTNASDRREALSQPPTPVTVVMPEANPRRGRILFITNGCVICHQINGVGGTAAPSLSQPDSGYTVNPLDFSARMWSGASAMTALQSIELGYVIDLQGQDIADIAAFTASPDERALLTLDSVPVEMRDWFLNTPYWRMNEWSEYMERGERIPLEEDSQ